MDYEGPYKMPAIEPKLAAYKASTLPTSVLGVFLRSKYLEIPDFKDCGSPWKGKVGKGCLLDIGEVSFDWDIVNPWFQLWIEEFQPLIANMENK